MLIVISFICIHFPFLINYIVFRPCGNCRKENIAIHVRKNTIHNIYWKGRLVDRVCRYFSINFDEHFMKNLYEGKLMC